MAARFIDNLDAIVQACDEAEPFMYAVHKNRIVQLTIGDE